MSPLVALKHWINVIMLMSYIHTHDTCKTKKLKSVTLTQTLTLYLKKSFFKRQKSLVKDSTITFETLPADDLGLSLENQIWSSYSCDADNKQTLHDIK